MATCSNPGCDQPGTNRCSACQTTHYCGPICQTTDWSHHKEECPGHLRKIGMTHLQKAKGFKQEQNWPQTLRHADLAATKLKQMQERPIEVIDEALRCKYNALNFMGRHGEALECAKEWYCLWPTHTHPHAIKASFSLIESSIINKEFFDAAFFARTLWETIQLSQDSDIPEHLQQPFTARGAAELARATLALAEHGGIPPKEQQEAGVEAIMLARRALEINTQLYGAQSEPVANVLGVLSRALDFFNDIDDDDEVLRLHEQAKAIYAREQGNLSPNVAASEYNLGVAYNKRTRRAYDANDLDRYVANLELALPHLREASRIYRAINHMENGAQAAQHVADMEEKLRIATARRKISRQIASTGH